MTYGFKFELVANISLILVDLSVYRAASVVVVCL